MLLFTKIFSIICVDYTFLYDSTHDVVYIENGTIVNESSSEHPEIDIESMKINGSKFELTFLDTPSNADFYKYKVAIYWNGLDVSNWTTGIWSDQYNVARTHIVNESGSFDYFLIGEIAVNNKKLIFPIPSSKLILNESKILDLDVTTRFLDIYGEYQDELNFSTKISSGFSFVSTLFGITVILVFSLIFRRKKTKHNILIQKIETKKI
jgi:hypothetical protein